MHTSTTTRHLQAHRYAGLEPGPKLIVTGAVHGNETCGTRAIERVHWRTLDAARSRSSRGSAHLRAGGNPLAYAHARRTGDRNLNRRLQPTATPADNEDRIANVLCRWLAEHDVLLDLHAFRSPGRPFVLRGPADNRGALEPFAQRGRERGWPRTSGPHRIVDGWMEAYAGGVDAAPRPACATRRGRRGDRRPQLRRRHHRVHALAGRLRHHARMRPARRPGRTRGGGYHAIRQALALLGLADLPLRPPARPFECLRLAEVVDRHARR